MKYLSLVFMLVLTACSTPQQGTSASTVNSSPQCGFMQEFFGGVDCRQEQMNSLLRNCATRQSWIEKAQCKNGVIATYSDAPFTGKILSYNRLMIEKVRTRKISEAEAEYSIQQKVAEINQRIARMNASNQQLYLAEREQDMQAHQARMERLNNTMQNNQKMLLDSTKTNQMKTECRPDVLSGGVNCTSYSQ